MPSMHSASDSEPIELRGRCFTADPRHPWAERVSIESGRIAAVDGDATQLARTIELGDAVAVPGLIDAHMHLLMGGLGLEQLDLSAIASRGQFEAAIERRRRELDAAGDRGRWLEAWGWSAERWPDRRDPDAEWLRAAGERPAIAWRMDRHACVVNRAALAAIEARVPGLPEPPGGRVVRDLEGAPTGLLVETAAWRLAIPAIPAPSTAAKRAALRAAEAHLHRMGLVAVGAMEYLGEVEEAFLPDRAERTLRVQLTLLDREWPLDPAIAAAVPADDRLAVIGFKAFADGTLGLRTARMLEPYADRPGDRGLLVELALDGHLGAWARLVHEAGLSPSIHAIGDEAMRRALDAYEPLDAMQALRPGAAPPPRIEHCQTVHPDDLPRCRGRMLSVQPLHRCDDALVIERALGAERLDRFFPLRSLLAQGATLAFGSDWPVVPPDPIAGIRAAVTGVDAKGGIFRPEESIGVAAALLASTVHAATCLGLRQCGRIRSGWHADLTILDRDPFGADWLADPPRVLATIAGGRLAWDGGIGR